MNSWDFPFLGSTIHIIYVWDLQYTYVMQTHYSIHIQDNTVPWTHWWSPLPPGSHCTPSRRQSQLQFYCNYRKQKWVRTSQWLTRVTLTYTGKYHKPCPCHQYMDTHSFRIFFRMSTSFSTQVSSNCCRRNWLLFRGRWHSGQGAEGRVNTESTHISQLEGVG